jgi:hypothetical protein
LQRRRARRQARNKRIEEIIRSFMGEPSKPGGCIERHAASGETEPQLERSDQHLGIRTPARGGGQRTETANTELVPRGLKQKHHDHANSVGEESQQLEPQAFAVLENGCCTGGSYRKDRTRDNSTCSRDLHCHRIGLVPIMLILHGGTSGTSPEFRNSNRRVANK